MRVFVEVKETELTKSFKELEKNLYEAEKMADWIRALSQGSEPKALFEQIMESNHGKFIFSVEVDLEKEREIGGKVAEKAEELKVAIMEYEKQLIKKISLALDGT